MAQALVLTGAADGAVLPALALLSHTVRTAPAHAASLASLGGAQVIIVDARGGLAEARALCRVIGTAGIDVPVLVVVEESGLAAVGADWDAGDIVLTSATPGEVEARLRILLGRADAQREPSRFTAAGVTIDESSYTAKVLDRTLDLTYKEFELLRFLASHTDRVFTREQLLSEVWGYDYFGGTRTVDVHVRRLRAKLGEHDGLIRTVRNVGYLFSGDDTARARAEIVEHETEPATEQETEPTTAPATEPEAARETELATARATEHETEPTTEHETTRETESQTDSTTERGSSVETEPRTGRAVGPAPPSSPAEKRTV